MTDEKQTPEVSAPGVTGRGEGADANCDGAGSPPGDVVDAIGALTGAARGLARWHCADTEQEYQRDREEERAFRAVDIEMRRTTTAAQAQSIAWNADAGARFAAEVERHERHLALIKSEIAAFERIAAALEKLAEGF